MIAIMDEVSTGAKHRLTDLGSGAPALPAGSRDEFTGPAMAGPGHF
jgi:hypothetical protein